MRTVVSLRAMVVGLLLLLLAAAAAAQPERKLQVSLSANAIQEVLRQHPGLLLQVKKAVMAAAYEQGRLLDPQELTDEAVFRLLEVDHDARVLATREIESRGYLELRPTREEAERAERARRRAEALALAAEAEEAEAPARRRSLRPRPTAPSAEPREELPRARPEDALQLLAAAGEAAARGEQETFPEERELAAVRPPAPPERNLRRMSPTVAQPAPAIVRRPNPYAGVPSLYDLYAQAARRAPVSERFGMDLFRDEAGHYDELPMDLPAGPEYVLGPGDGLNIELWGGVTQRLQRVVDREGRIALPEVGLVPVAGRSLGEVQQAVQSVLRTQFRNVEADLSLTRLRSVRIYVVGDVQRPGPYDISSLSTPLNALYAAGGPTERGSLRRVRHYRAAQLVQEVDLYDLILRGVRSDLERLQAGDSVLVPPLQGDVAVEGMVRRPAVYELRDERNLAQVLELAGGVLSTGMLSQIEVERIEAHERRTMLNLRVEESGDREQLLRALEGFAVQDGDRIRISPIAAYSQAAVYLEGHVFRPGKYAWREGMRVSDLIGSRADLLPEPSARHAEIIRLNPPDFRPVVLSFNLAEALAGQDELLRLQPLDTVRIYGRYDFEDPPAITVAGEVRQPGEHRVAGETHLRDAIYLAGGLTPDALLEEAQVFRRGAGSRLQVLSLNLAGALRGDPASNVLLQPRDRIIVQRNPARVDPASVYIKGEVANPGRYPLGEGMTAGELVRLAGGLKRGAFTERADLSRALQDGSGVSGEHREVEIARALAGVAEADVTLRDGDTLSIRQLAGWQDIGAAVTLRGEVRHAGTYGIRAGERLSEVLRRAGGLRETAYPAGAVLERVQVRELAEKARQELIRRIEQTEPRLAAEGSGEQAAMVEAVAAQRNLVLERLRREPATGRLVVRISADLTRWENTTDDIELRAGDVLHIPKRPNFVLVSGQVYNASAISYRPGKSAGWYLRRAGGPTDLAKRNAIFIVRADGSVVGEGSGGWWRSNVLGTRMQPGDSIVVPERVISGSTFWRGLVQAAQVTSSLAIAARVATSF